MKRILSVLVLSQISFVLSAQTVELSAAVDPKISENKFFSNSKEFLILSKKALATGNYGEAQSYAVEAVKSARLSDQYLSDVIKMSQATEKITAAYNSLSKADKENAAKSSPKQFSSAMAAYNQAVDAHNLKQWDNAITNANKVMAFLSTVGMSGAGNTSAKTENITVAAVNNKSANADSFDTSTTTTKSGNDKSVPLPAQYTVRSWDSFGDCLWNIAERNWAYGDGHRWVILYNANKHKLPDPANPNWIEPGMIMDIPSLKGETRQGMWDSALQYSPVK